MKTYNSSSKRKKGRRRKLGRNRKNKRKRINWRNFRRRKWWIKIIKKGVKDSKVQEKKGPKKKRKREGEEEKERE